MERVDVEPASEKIWESNDLNRPKLPVLDPGPGAQKEYEKPPSDVEVGTTIKKRSNCNRLH